MILEKSVYNDMTVHHIVGNTWLVWYPMDSIVEDLEATNSVLENLGFTLHKVAIKTSHTDFPFD